MHFDTIVFLHALYVGFVYSMLAFGATYYRQIVDDIDLEEVRLGEDIFLGFTPVIWLSVGAFFFVFCIFTVISLLQSEGNIFLYIIPIACSINIIQLLWRARNQRLMIKTNGIVIRHLLIEGNIPIEFSVMAYVRISEYIGWFKVDFYDEDITLLGSFHSDTQTLSVLVRSIRQKNPTCSLEFEGNPELAANM